MDTHTDTHRAYIHTPTSVTHHRQVSMPTVDRYLVAYRVTLSGKVETEMRTWELNSPYKSSHRIARLESTDIKSRLWRALLRDLTPSQTPPSLSQSPTVS